MAELKAKISVAQKSLAVAKQQQSQIELALSGSKQASASYLDLIRAPYAWYGVNHIDLVSLVAPSARAQSTTKGQGSSGDDDDGHDTILVIVAIVAGNHARSLVVAAHPLAPVPHAAPMLPFHKRK